MNSLASRCIGFLPALALTALLTTPCMAEKLPSLDESLAAISEGAANVIEADPQEVPLPASFLLLLAALGGFVMLTGRTD